MKCVSKFDETVNHKLNLYPAILKKFKSFPDDLAQLQNIILYGPDGVGKYTLALKLIYKYSAQKLKYEKKLTLWSPTLKSSYVLKMSDIHYEIDMSTLGCNAKSLWHDIFVQLVDSILVKKTKMAILLCKVFHEINNELLDVFYSYLQPMNNLILYGIRIKFVLLTTQLSFLPNSILTCCKVMSVPMPTKSSLSRCFGGGAALSQLAFPHHQNLIQYKLPNKCQHLSISFMCDHLVLFLRSPTKTFKISKLRDYLYELLSYNMNIHDVMWYIYFQTFQEIRAEKMSSILLQFYNFFYCFNNNYRPIFHMELMFLSLKLAMQS